MSITNVLASVAVKDLNAAVKWSEKLLGASASKPMPEVAEWKFERGGWLQVYELAERAGSGSFTLVVNDMDEQISPQETWRRHQSADCHSGEPAMQGLFPVPGTSGSFPVLILGARRCQLQLLVAWRSP